MTRVRTTPVDRLARANALVAGALDDLRRQTAALEALDAFTRAVGDRFYQIEGHAYAGQPEYEINVYLGRQYTHPEPHRVGDDHWLKVAAPTMGGALEALARLLPQVHRRDEEGV